jgi:hypothetical protein
MSHVRAVVLQSPVPNSNRLKALVEQSLTDEVSLIAISGRNAFSLEAEVDWLIIGDGSAPERILCTSAHHNEENHDGLSDSICLAGSFSGGNGVVDRVYVIGRAFFRYQAPS